tara:strand:+ start:1567 stop:2151 length:585 start_codon:yes stop_codon:yes gene_type:complete
MAKLLQEFQLFEYEVPSDAKWQNENGNKSFLSGTLQRANAENQNNRIYPRPILERESQKFQTLIEENRALGELDHPDNAVVNLANASHLIKELWWDGDDLKGVVEVLDTPAGSILKSLVESGVKLGISSRGLGSTQKNSNGKDIVQDDFQLVTFDFVSNPSTQNAFMMAEGKELDKETERAFRINHSLDTILKS